MSKIFIIGLPRTGTTSLCATLLELGFKTAHTAYTIAAIEQAEVIADTPAYVDYPFFDRRYPGSKYIYLDRDLEHWLPSIKGLLIRMEKNINNDNGGFNPILKRCFKSVFEPFDHQYINSSQHLKDCYLKHKNNVFDYFTQRADNFISLTISDPKAPAKLLNFLGISNPKITAFPHLNIGQQVVAWNRIDSPLKVTANLSGSQGRKYFIY
jgi:hypothetical protein